ncbi:cyclopropane-fatty-acyl-phospholipid synthase [Auriculariales sp. MPI-PUGE-AT-0066]|nr:cyclopropane-fatty-acyl-phospholipid synthase [Auriculariales sp. MPI-PUGE-AT-0066]
MSQRLLTTPARHSQWSLLSAVDTACSYATDTLLALGSTPLACVGELGVVGFLQRMKHGNLRIITQSQVYRFPPVAKGVVNEHPHLFAELVVIRDTFWTRMLTMGDLGFAESYMYGDVQCDDLRSLFKVFMVNRDELATVESGRLVKLFTAVPRYITNSRFANTLSTSRSNISAHYDISNAMFQGFLSSDMMYSCAIFDDLDGDLKQPYKPVYMPIEKPERPKRSTPEGSESSSTVGDGDVDELHEAQLRKVEHILAKAKLQDGHRILEIGSGWGELAIQACRLISNCTVDTITLSSEQKELAEARIAAAGFTDRVRVHLMDYRRMPEEWKGSFDRVISIEMVEAVGLEFLPEYFSWIDWALKPRGGVGVVQGITMPETRFETYHTEVDFIRKWPIFPGGLCPTISLLISSLNKGSQNRLIVDSVDNIGPHYARTLREWARRFDACFDTVIAPTLRSQHPSVMDGPNGVEELAVFRRKWMYYFQYCEIGFATRTLGDVILTFTREADASYGCNVFA